MSCFVIWGLYLTVPWGFLQSRSILFSSLFPGKWHSAGHREGAEELLSARPSNTQVWAASNQNIHTRQLHEQLKEPLFNSFHHNPLVDSSCSLMNDILVTWNTYSTYCQMIPREQLQLVAALKMTHNYFQFHRSSGRGWGLFCWENINHSSWYNPVPESTVGDVSLLSDNVSVRFPVVNVILLTCTCLNFPQIHKIGII